MDTESGRERERKWVWERAEIFMINDFTGQCRASALSPWGASGLSQCARRSKLTAPRWVISEHYLNVHTQLHILYLYIYIYMYAVYIFFTHSLLQYCHFALQFERHEIYIWCLIFIVSVTCSQCDDKCTVQWPEWPEEKVIAPLSDMI